MAMKFLSLLTIDEAIAQSSLEAPSACARPAVDAQVNRRPPAPSLASLPSRTREYVLPPPLRPGPLSIRLD